MQRRPKSRPSWGRVRNSLTVGVWTFTAALLVTAFSAAVIVFLPTFIAVLVILLIVLIGIVFDMVGLATAAATEAPFHAMAAKRSPGALQAIFLIRNADFVSSLCNDLIGDICGTVGGAATAAIGFRLVAGGLAWDQDLLNVIMVSAVAALTVGGKAAGKGYALERANDIVLRVAVAITALRRLRGGGSGTAAVAVRSRRRSGANSGEVKQRGRRVRG